MTFLFMKVWDSFNTTLRFEFLIGLSKNVKVMNWDIFTILLSHRYTPLQKRRVLESNMEHMLTFDAKL